MFLKQTILGVGVTTATAEEVLEYVRGIMCNFTKKCMIVTPNPEIIVYASDHKDFQDTLNRADIAICDGVGVYLAAMFLGKPIKQRITGVDFVKKVCEISKEQPITVGFVGGGMNVAERASECLRQNYPKLTVAFAFAGNPDQETVERIKNEELRMKNYGLRFKNGQDAEKHAPTDQNASKTTSEKIKGYHPSPVDMLFVAFGHPKQEEWIAENLHDLPVKVAMGVGGALDYISGEVTRAPSLLRSLGLEWLYRLILQPWRIKRQLKLVQFIWLVIAEKYKRK